MARKQIASADEAAELAGSAFSRWLRNQMRSANKDINEIVADSGVSWMTVHNIINDITPNPQKATKIKLANSLHVNIPKYVENETKEESNIAGIGELIDFDPHNTSELPKLSGVYVFYDIAGRPLYIGRSKNVANRVKQHSDKFWFRAPLVQTGAYVQIEDEKLQQQVEEILIKFLKNNAVINKQRVERDS